MIIDGFLEILHFVQDDIKMVCGAHPTRWIPAPVRDKFRRNDKLCYVLFKECLQRYLS
jgi:hypothetical protein